MSEKRRHEAEDCEEPPSEPQLRLARDCDGFRPSIWPVLHVQQKPWLSGMREPASAALLSLAPGARYQPQVGSAWLGPSLQPYSDR